LPEQPPHLRIGIDTGGTFTDLLAWDGRTLRRAKVPSTPPDFDRGVIAAIHAVLRAGESAELIHGSTVATNALLERKGHPIAFITTEGFRDMLLIGRQNRPSLYALEPRREPLIVAMEHNFTVAERIDAAGNVLQSLSSTEIDRIISEIAAAGLKHVAICLLFSFINPIHEQMLGDRCRAAGLTVTLSSELLPEFREYERACATAINAALRPNVENYLTRVTADLPTSVKDFRVMQSAGGTLPPADAGRLAVRLLLSGPAGGVVGASYVAELEEIQRIITYDMGGTSTDVAASADGKPPWTTSAMMTGLPVALPMFDIHTIGAGGGSIASLDAGGALRVGPRSAGANPGPACYGRGGTLPTVTDANLVLGRLLPGKFLGGKMSLSMDAADAAIAPLAKQMGKSVHETALGILRIAESSMASAIRHVTARRGHDPRTFTLVCFGGAGGLHAAALAESLDIPRVMVPPYAGVLSALGMLVAPATADVSQTVVHLGEQLDDSRLHSEFSALSLRSAKTLPMGQTERIEMTADCRFRGQSYEVMVPVNRPSRSAVESDFREAYTALYGRCPEGRSTEVVTLRLRRIGPTPNIKLPPIDAERCEALTTQLVLPDGVESEAPVIDRPGLKAMGKIIGPALLLDPDSTMFIPPNWKATATAIGSVMLERSAV
jgi:N-methylhydantoinase A